jgi:hypothetical protein
MSRTLRDAVGAAHDGAVARRTTSLAPVDRNTELDFLEMRRHCLCQLYRISAA